MIRLFKNNTHTQTQSKQLIFDRCEEEKENAIVKHQIS